MYPCVGWALVWCGVAGCASAMRDVARLAMSCAVWGRGGMASWNSGFGLPGYCSEMSLPGWWRD